MPSKPSSDSPAKRRAVPPSRVSGQLETILASPAFEGTGRTRAILRFIVEETLQGRTAEIKGMTIAIQVLGRPDSFNAATDPIVSIEARKLRQALERYYLSEGRSDAVEISVPSGTYIPVFCWRPMAHVAAKERARGSARWNPSLSVSPFNNCTGEEAMDSLCHGLTDEVVVGLTRFREISVMTGSGAGVGVRMEKLSGIVSGNVRMVGNRIKVGVQLEDASSGVCVWADHFVEERSRNLHSVIEEQIGRQIVARVGGEHGAVNRFLVPGMWVREALGDTTSYEAMIAYHQFDRQRTVGSLNEVSPLLHHAVGRDPANATLKAMLASTKIFTFAMGHSDEVSSLESALDLATAAVRLEPGNQFCLETQAWILFHLGDLHLALEHLRSAYLINPNAAYRVAIIGWDMMLCGAWEEGRMLLESAMELNPANPSWLWFAICFDEFRQARYEGALAETARPDLPLSFWVTLMQVAALGKLGRCSEAVSPAAELLKRSPEFHTKGRTLIARLIKERALFDAIVAGLLEGGIRID